MTGPIDVDAIRATFLQQCGIHDFGIIAGTCTCPEIDYRPVLSDVLAALVDAHTENERLSKIAEQTCDDCNGSGWATTRDGKIESHCPGCGGSGAELDRLYAEIEALRAAAPPDHGGEWRIEYRCYSYETWDTKRCSRCTEQRWVYALPPTPINPGDGAT